MKMHTACGDHSLHAYAFSTAQHSVNEALFEMMTSDHAHLLCLVVIKVPLVAFDKGTHNDLR